MSRDRSENDRRLVASLRHESSEIHLGPIIRSKATINTETRTLEREHQSSIARSTLMARFLRVRIPALQEKTEGCRKRVYEHRALIKSGEDPHHHTDPTLTVFLSSCQNYCPGLSASFFEDVGVARDQAVLISWCLLSSPDTGYR